jgi:hypothetical protein
MMEYEAREQWIRRRIVSLNSGHVSLGEESNYLISDIHPSEFKTHSNWDFEVIDVGEEDLFSIEILEKSTEREFEFWVRITQ